MASKGFTESTAADYSRGRPQHSVELMVAALTSDYGLAPAMRDAADASRPIRVVDVGAGTGKSLAAVAEAVAAVVPGAALDLHAVEPSGLATEIEATVPGSAVHACEATALPFDDASVDIVSIGQALHWFAGTAALREAQRVLRPEGRLLLAWNTRDACSTLHQAADGRVEVSATVDALRAVEAGSAGLPTAVETAVEFFYSPHVPRQQSGAWRRFARIDGGTSLLPPVAPAGVTIEQPDGGERLQQFGPFGRFPPSAFRAGAGLLGRQGNAGDLEAEAVEATALAASEGGARAGAGEEAVFALRHWRSWGAMASCQEDVLANFRSVSVVAAGDPSLRARVEASLTDVMAESPTVAGPGGERLHVLPLMQDVFVGRPIAN